MQWKFNPPRRWRAFLMLAPIIPVALLWHFRTALDPAPTRIAVDLSSRTLKVIEGGEVTHTYGIAVGRPGHPTPTGSFRTGDIVWNPAWNPPPTGWAANKSYQPPGAESNPMQGVKIYFRAPYYYIHGTNDPGSIGEAASHGCIRMIPEQAMALARIIQRSGGSVPMTISR